jgi:hypothetical protein
MNVSIPLHAFPHEANIWYRDPYGALKMIPNLRLLNRGAEMLNGGMMEEKQPVEIGLNKY